MYRLIFVSIILVIYACESNITNETTVGNPLVDLAIKEAKRANPDKLEFKFSIDTSYQNMEGKIMVYNCKLYNGNTDTLYFYTQSCFGWESNFIVDTNSVQIYNRIDCNVSNPIIEKVAPKSDFEFKGYFYVKNRKLKNIHLQYYIYQVDSDFDVRNSDSIRKLKKTIIKNTHNSCQAPAQDLTSLKRLI